MYNQPLTLEQQRFAENNHDLVYSFLRYKRLSDDYYDILIFGYLRAVRKWFDRPELQQYKFKTIADYAMKCDLINHYRKQYRQKRYAVILSLDAPVSYDESLIDTILVADTAADNLIYDSLLNKIADILSENEFSIVQMKIAGYNDREIAKKQGISVYSIREKLSSIKELVYADGIVTAD